jgi:hypothetical protein
MENKESKTDNHCGPLYERNRPNPSEFDNDSSKQYKLLVLYFGLIEPN